MKKIYGDFAIARLFAPLSSTVLARLWFEAVGLFGVMASVHAGLKTFAEKMRALKKIRTLSGVEPTARPQPCLGYSMSGAVPSHVPDVTLGTSLSLSSALHARSGGLPITIAAR